MNKFTRCLFQATSIALVAILQLTTTSSYVFAQEEAQTGSNILVESGSTLETDSSTGKIILEENDPITNSGSLSLAESGTGNNLEEEQSNTGTVLREETSDQTKSKINAANLFETETGSGILDLEETGTGEVLTESEGREKAMEEITEKEEYTEILIKYRDEKINVIKNSGKKQAKSFIEQKNSEIKPIF